MTKPRGSSKRHNLFCHSNSLSIILGTSDERNEASGLKKVCSYEIIKNKRTSNEVIIVVHSHTRAYTTHSLGPV